MKANACKPTRRTIYLCTMKKCDWRWTIAGNANCQHMVCLAVRPDEDLNVCACPGAIFAAQCSGKGMRG